jgi:hypothetical protein
MLDSGWGVVKGAGSREAALILTPRIIPFDGMPRLAQDCDDRQWRICFRWQDGDAYDVEIADYH